MSTSVSTASSASEALPPVSHDILLRAAKGELTPHIPVWAMRQAGRYLPEFRAMRATTDFFTMCNTPEKCSEVTIQPLRRFPALDAVVIFSDILIIPQAMGMEVLMQPGPVFPNPIRTPEDIDQLLSASFDTSPVFSPLYEGIRRTRFESAAIRSVPVIGFCGGPWTLFGYMVSGPLVSASDSAVPNPQRDKDKNYAKLFILNHPEASHRLLSRLTDLCVELLVGAYNAGANVLQVFESSGGDLPPALFSEFALPYLLDIERRVREHIRTAKASGAALEDPPMILFPRGAYAASTLRAFVSSGYDVLGVDWEHDAGEIVEFLIAEKQRQGRTQPIAIQGNMDPTLLYAPAGQLLSRLQSILRSLPADFPVVGNLGHGMSPGHDPRQLCIFMEGMHALSRRYREGGNPFSQDELDQMAIEFGKKMVVPAGF